MAEQAGWYAKSSYDSTICGNLTNFNFQTTFFIVSIGETEQADVEFKFELPTERKLYIQNFYETKETNSYSTI